MPLVKIEMLAGKTPEYKKTVFDCVHQGLIDAFSIEDWDRFQRINEYDKSNCCNRKKSERINYQLKRC